MNMRLTGPAAALLLAGSLCSEVAAQEAGNWTEDLERWHREREERLRAEDGWLTLVGLYWLEPGASRFGSGPDLPVPLKAEGVAAWAGTFHLADGAVSVEAAPGAKLAVGGAPLAGRRPLADDVSDAPDILEVGRLRLQVIRRGERIGVRVKDPESAVRKGFTGIERFPVDASYRVSAMLARFAAPREVEIPTAAGTVEKLLAPGTVEFDLQGEKLALLPLVGEPDEKELWFIFKDATSGKETYGFRYLYGTLGEDGRVEVDFNRAYNPPCAFTPYATCALPPKENRLERRIEAGERIYGKH